MARRKPHAESCRTLHFNLEHAISCFVHQGRVRRLAFLQFFDIGQQYRSRINSSRRSARRGPSSFKLERFRTRSGCCLKRFVAAAFQSQHFICVSRMQIIGYAVAACRGLLVLQSRHNCVLTIYYAFLAMGQWPLLIGKFPLGKHKRVLP